MAAPAIDERLRRRSAVGALTVPGLWLTLTIAGVAFYVAYDDGSYDLSSRSTLAIAAWWTILLGVGLGIWPRRPIPRTAIAAGGFLLALAAWTLASAAW